MRAICYVLARMGKALICLMAFVCLGGARASVTTAFVWADAQPPTVSTLTKLAFHDSVHDTDVSLTALGGAFFITHDFDPSFPSLPSPLGPLGTGKEDFKVAFSTGLSITDILVTANVPVLDSAGDIIDAETIGGATRIGTEEKTSTGVTFTEQLNRGDVLDLSMTNFLFSTVPEPATWLMVSMAVVLGALLLRSRVRMLS